MIYHIRSSAFTRLAALGSNLLRSTGFYQHAALAMPDLYPLIRPALRRLPAEAAHELTVRALEAGLGRLIVDRAARRPDPPILAQRLWGLELLRSASVPVGRAPPEVLARVEETLRRERLPPGERGALEFTAALMRWRRRFDITLDVPGVPLRGRP